MLKSFAIEIERGIVIHPAHQVAQVRGRQEAAGESFEIADAKRVGGAINGGGLRLRPGADRQRAGREKTQKLASIRRSRESHRR